jgi:LacI family transcriptional regulator, repressor for deo operon, udp, cdd, tsx, nupC, and nupG
MEVNMIEAECSRAGLRLTASSFHNDENRLTDLLNELRQRYADGIIIIDPIENCDALKKWHDDGIPIVLVSNSPDMYPEIDTYVNNTAGSVENIIDHLVQLGHTKIAGIFTSIDLVPNSVSFWNGWTRALEKNGKSPDPELYFPIIYSLEEPETSIYDHAYKATQNFLKRFDKNDPLRPTAVFTMGDSIAIPVIKAFEEQGWIIPEDISIVSNYISELGRYFSVPLTGVYQDRIALRAGAAKCLIERIKGKNRSGNKRVVVYSDQKLIVRSSTKKL